jgi:hypothetical protein
MRKEILIIFFISIVLITSCQRKHRDFQGPNPSLSENYFLHDSQSGETPIEYLLVQNKPSKDLIFEINEGGVVFTDFTSEELDSLETSSKEDFSNMMDDLKYYMSEVTLKIDSIKIRTFSTKKRYIRFTNSKAESFLIDTRKLQNNLGWYIYFFNMAKKPRVINSAEISTSLIREYFDK